VALGSVIAGAALFGPIGALIGIPIAAVALAMIDTFSKRHELVPELASLEAVDDEDQSADDLADVAPDPADRTTSRTTTVTTTRTTNEPHA